MKTNEVLEAIKYRRSVFQAGFSEEEIQKEELEILLEAANSAPTHKRTQPWRFVVFHGENGLQTLGNELSSIYKKVTPPEKYNEQTEVNMQSKATTSKAAIAIVVDYSGELPEWEELAATSCAAQNIWLAAYSIGLAGYWASPGLIQHLGDLLSLKENQKCIGIFYLGKPKSTEKRKGFRSSIEDKVRWVE